ncbi:MAG: hypothetical protein OEW58_06520 [Gammaproteobacteria bacterium]|nr:hypothetical protein [Gammaproteobacteria bacterium]
MLNTQRPFLIDDPASSLPETPRLMMPCGVRLAHIGSPNLVKHHKDP